MDDNTVEAMKNYGTEDEIAEEFAYADGCGRLMDEFVVEMPMGHYDYLAEIATKYNLIVRACQTFDNFDLAKYVRFIVGPDGEFDEGKGDNA